MNNNKSLQKLGRGAMDYRADNNLGIIVVMWVDNSVVQLVSNYAGIEPMSEISRWCKKDKELKSIPCSQIIKKYNKSTGGADLADMLIALYRILSQTKRWYQKMFWHLIDTAKFNAWMLYQQHADQNNTPSKEQKSLLVFCSDIASALIHANKPIQSSSCGRPAKRQSIDLAPRVEKPTVLLPVNDVRYDEVGHWPVPVMEKNRCCNCQMTCR